MANETQHVVPNAKGGWSVKRAGFVRPLSTYETQKEAIQQARKLSIDLKSKMIIHRKDGTIREVRSYAGITSNDSGI